MLINNQKISYIAELNLNSTSAYKHQVLKIVENLNIKYLDIYDLIFINHEDPKSLFPLRGQGHYNSLGYSKIAVEIKKIIK